ncbi:MAG: lysylphosphatidylglycerol synthase transmembrane domain-containing protein [Lachnospiraceae bacterium]
MKGKKLLSAVLFLGLAAITFYVVFKNQDFGELMEAIGQMQKGYLVLAIVTALFFVSAEGILIWYLLKSIGDKAKLLSCLKYSFTGFFYSGITPSATGGQPMQLYYMSKDGHKVADSTVVLMSVATAYKLVLVLMGVGISVFWWGGLQSYLGAYLPLYFLGLFLNAALVAILLAIMLNGPGMERFIHAAERLLVKLHLLKPSDKRKESIHTLVEQYQETVGFLKTHVRVVGFLLGFTFIQRCSVFILTYFVYKGMGLTGTNAFTVMALQAVVYIAVDMLPLPGSQGITELMYTAVFRNVFVGSSLTVSMCISRGLNFYMLLIISAVVAAYCWWHTGGRKRGEDKISKYEE